MRTVAVISALTKKSTVCYPFCAIYHCSLVPLPGQGTLSRSKTWLQYREICTSEVVCSPLQFSASNKCESLGR